MANKQILADELFNKQFELLDFTTTDQINNQDLPIVLLAGGIHGNEIRGIEAVSHLVQSLKKNDNPMISNILSNIRLHVIPILNVVGHLAGVRCCPQTGEIIQYNEKTQEVILPQDQSVHNWSSQLHHNERNYLFAEFKTVYFHQILKEGIYWKVIS